MQLYAGQYHNLCQQPGENLTVYASALRRLVRFALPRDVSDTTPHHQLLVEQYVDGLHDVRIKTALRENWPNSLSAVVTRMLELQAARDVEQILIEPARVSQQSSSILPSSLSEPFYGEGGQPRLEWLQHFEVLP